jgi:heterodisulfide reductase subunit D
MKLSTTLESIMGGIYACTRCHVCTYGPWPENHTFCPLYERDETFTASAGGLLYLAKAILGKRIDYNEEVADLVYTCVACGACDKCTIVRSINPLMALSDIIRLFRYELVKRGLVPKGPISKMYENVKKNGDLLGNGSAKTLKIPASVQNGKADTLLIAECLHTEAEVKSLDAALALLTKMDKQVAIFADPGCCGSTLYDFGFWDQLPALVQSKWKQISNFRKKNLLFVDPHCQEFMTNKYRKILDGFNGFKGQHFSELLLQAFKNGDIKSKKGTKMKVSYHDPCFLGRGLGIYDAPRQVIGHLNGVTLVEMKRNREQSFCCGARGLGNYWEDFAETTAGVRIQEFQDTKADILITACPYCKEIFGRVLGKDGHRVRDLVEFVGERLE